jgi:MFS transporter, YNFM family, putative membrane transport protein
VNEPSSLAAPAAGEKLRFGSPAYMRCARAMFAGGFSTFSMLYCVQPLLPLFAHNFHLTPATASGAVSVATGSMALALIPASLLSDRLGRSRVMSVSLILSALLMMGTAIAPGFGWLLLMRALLGVVLAGLPAVGMAYLSEEVEPASQGRALGLYIAGNALGGMCGRLLAAMLCEWFSWRFSLGILGVAGFIGALLFWRGLPPSRFFTPRPVDPAHLMASTRKIFADAGLPLLFLCGFVLMGCFVSLYNLLGFRLEMAPFSLTPGEEGLIFTLYMIGMFGSAWAGRLADRIGRRKVLHLMVLAMAIGLLLTAPDTLASVVIGIAVFTFGFFGGHSVASSWIGLRAGGDKALASALYLSSYYLGSSVLGTACGWLWGRWNWPGVIGGLTVALVVCLAAALRLGRVPPLPASPDTKKGA